MLNPIQPIGRQQWLHAPGQLLDQLVAIQAQVEQLGIGQGLMLRSEMTISLKKLPVLAKVFQKSDKAAGL